MGGGDLRVKCAASDSPFHTLEIIGEEIIASPGRRVWLPSGVARRRPSLPAPRTPTSTHRTGEKRSATTGLLFFDCFFTRSAHGKLMPRSPKRKSPTGGTCGRTTTRTRSARRPAARLADGTTLRFRRNPSPAPGPLAATVVPQIGGNAASAPPRPGIGAFHRLEFLQHFFSSKGQT